MTATATALAFCASSARCRVDCEVTALPPVQSMQAVYLSGLARLVYSCHSCNQAVPKLKPLHRLGKRMCSSRASFPMGPGAGMAGRGISTGDACLCFAVCLTSQSAYFHDARPRYSTGYTVLQH
jgi:hypothetical protein